MSEIPKKKTSIFLSANGMNKHTCKNWCKFIFQDFFHSVETNNQNRCFDIFLKDSISDIDGKVHTIKSKNKVTPLEEIFGDITISEKDKKILNKRIEDLLNQKDEFDLSYFKEYWGREFNLILLKRETIKK